MKDYFFFSKSQKIGIVILLAIIVTCIVTIKLMPRHSTAKTDDEFACEAQIFKESLEQSDEKNNFAAKADTFTLFTFDPNTLDSAGFVSLGLKPYIAHNICHYREKGGHFRTPNDFAKIYGISEKKFNSLKPFIQIHQQELNEKKPDYEPPTYENKKQASPKNTNTTPNIIVELNTCDTTALKQLPGIGSSFAKRIVAYRNKIGGYCNAEQLLEVYGMDAERLQKIKPYLKFDLNNIRKINANTASVERLKAHPYINFYVAKAIYDQRKKLGKLTSTTDLKGLKDIDEATLQKITPYLGFE